MPTRAWPRSSTWSRLTCASEIVVDEGPATIDRNVTVVGVEGLYRRTSPTWSSRRRARPSPNGRALRREGLQGLGIHDQEDADRPRLRLGEGHGAGRARRRDAHGRLRLPGGARPDGRFRAHRDRRPRPGRRRPAHAGDPGGAASPCDPHPAGPAVLDRRHRRGDPGAARSRGLQRRRHRAEPPGASRLPITSCRSR